MENRKHQAAVVPLRAKKGLRLSEDERLRMENLSLKMQLIEQTAAQRVALKIAPMLEARKAIGDEIGERLGIEVTAYEANLETGELTPINGGDDPAEGVNGGESKNGG